MRALVQTANGSPDVLRIENRPEPSVGPGEVRVRVRACGLNFAELMARVGLYPDAPKPPCVLGYEVAGEVESIGSGVEGIVVGQRVIAGTHFGGFAELAVAKQADVMELPEGFTFEQGAAVPVVYGTAYMAVIRLGNVQPGERMLVHAAAGGVGIAATQLARQAGAEVFGTASAAKHDAIRAQGVEHPIDYRSVDVAEEVRRIAGGHGMDVILDARGGTGFRESFKLLAAGGRLVMYGVSEMMSGERRNLLAVARTVVGTPRFNAIRLMSKSKAAIGLNMLELWKEKGSLADAVLPVTELMKQGAIVPVIAETFPLERAADAHRFIQQRKNIGKVVLTVSREDDRAAGQRQPE